MQRNGDAFTQSEKLKNFHHTLTFNLAFPVQTRPNGNKIFRKVTPERSVASMGLLFVKKILLE
ncbi:Hypothetical protein AJF4211_001450 [Avibacterium paragallinarum JF4211]|nr:hypothetical protein Z012_04615 [Avibacterium paragallinarum]TID13344.1 hypothetical protein JO83_11490 [Avibacterium paragallinarum]CDF99429.1 Hypothetical protein AJF4211_001450 [Avibacterium paragallinarum JF4211]